MKNKRFSKKLVLNKTTIARLGHLQMRNLYGRDADVDGCMTEPEPSCNLETINQPDCISIWPFCPKTEVWPFCPDTKAEDCYGDITMSIHPCIC